MNNILTPEMKEAIQRGQEGKLIAIPTETVYGLAARIDLSHAIESIFTTKERPFFDPLIVHVSSIEQAKGLTTGWNTVTELLASSFWPGPLTLVLPKSKSVNSMITSGLETVGIRMPNHPLTLKLIEAVGAPMAAPSANKFGKTSPSCAQHVREEFQSDDLFVLDGGSCEIGIESTVLLVKNGINENSVSLSILRKGHVLKSNIEKVLLENKITYNFFEPENKSEAPGQMKHHYMPKLPLFILTKKMDHSSLLQLMNNSLATLPDVIDHVKISKPTREIKVISELILSQDPVLASRELYSNLRSSAEKKGVEAIYFQKTSLHQGEHWDSLFDRLNKAATLIL